MPTEKNQSDPQTVARSGESSSSRTSSSELDGIAGSSASWTSNTLTLGPLSPHVANTSPLERLTDPTASYVPLPGAVSHTSADPQPMQHQGPSLATGIVTGHGMPDFEALDWSELLGDVDWVNINDTERDHLLALYFTQQRIFGFDVHIYTFMTRVRSTELSERPHPCLLYAMFLVSCGSSQLPHLREKEDWFYDQSCKAAARLLHEAEDRDPNCILDVIRAYTLVATWLYWRDRSIEAWPMLGQATHLAKACYMDRISSSKYIPHAPNARHWCAQDRNSRPLLTPPKSQVELADRIAAFWGLFVVERTAATALHLPAAFDLDRVITPLPRPWAEYEADSDTNHLDVCDERICDFARSRASHPCSDGVDHGTDFGYSVKALVAMHEAAMAPLDAEAPRHLLREFRRDLPTRHKVPAHNPDGSPTITSDTATIQFLLLAAELYLCQEDLELTPTAETLAIIKRAIGLMSLLANVDVGDFSLFILLLWLRMANILVSHKSSLEAEGDLFAATTYDKDIDIILTHLRRAKQNSLIDNTIASLLERR